MAKTNLEGQLKEWANRYCQGVAEGAAQLLEEEMQNIMQIDYYDEYPKPPRKYNRTYNFRNNSFGSFIEKTATGFRGGIILTPEDMDEYENAGWSKEKIWGANLWGLHGQVFAGTSPLESIRSFANSSAFISSVNSMGWSYAGKLN